MSQRALKQYIELYHLGGIADFFTEKRKPKVVKAPIVQPARTDDFFTLKNQIKNCQNCSLGSTRIKPVFGVGNLGVKAFIIGNPPNPEENLSGKPFIGSYGLKLNDMIKAVQLTRADLYLTLICKCRGQNSENSPQNSVMLSEIKKCKPILTQELQIIQPKIILIFGLIAANTFFDKDENMDFYRNNQGTTHDNIPVYVTYNPAEILKDPKLKIPTWVDLQLFRDHYRKI